MKKHILPGFLILCVLLSLCLAFSGCADLATPSVKLSNAVEATAKQFVSVLPMEVIEKALTSGSVKFAYKNQDGTEMNAALYCDAKSEKYALIADGTVEGEALSASLYSGKEQIIFGSKELLGDSFCGLELKTLKDDFASSVFMNENSEYYIGEDAAEAFNSLIDTLTSDDLPSSDAFSKIAGDYWNEFFSLLKKNDCVTEKSEGGTRTVTVIINEKQAVSIVKALAAKIKGDAELRKLLNYYLTADSAVNRSGNDAADALDDFYSSLDDLVEEVEESDDEFTIEFTADINKKTNLISAASLTVKDDSDDKMLDIDFVNTDEEISVKITADGMKFTAKLAVGANTKDEFNGKLTLSQKSASYEKKIIVDLSWDKNTGDYKIVTDAANEDKGVKANSVTVTGSYKPAKNTAVLTVNKVVTEVEYTDDVLACGIENRKETLEIDLTVTFSAKDAMPDFPEYRNALKLSEDELDAIGEKLSERFPSIGVEVPGIGIPEVFPGTDSSYDFE